MRISLRRLAAEHPHEFFDTGFAFAGGQGRASTLQTHFLIDDELPGGGRRDLWQMGDAKNLSSFGELPQAVGHFGGDFAAHVCVNLVEDQQCHIILSGQNPLDGEHDPGNLPAGGDHSQRTGFLARIGGKQKFGDFVAQRAAGGNPGNREATLRKSQVCQIRADEFLESLGGSQPRFGQRRADCAQPVLCGGNFRIERV